MKGTEKVLMSAISTFALIGVVLLASCGNGGSNAAFVGIWVYYDGKGNIDNFELLKDGTGTIDGKKSVSWKIKDNRFVITSEQFGMSCNYDISNDDLTLINDNGDTTLFVKKESAKAFYKTGMKEKWTGNYDNAITGFTEAIRLDTNFVKAYIGRGEAYFAKEDYDKAVSDYTKTLELNPNDVSVYLARVEAYSQKKDYEKAIADLELELQKADSASDEEKFIIAEGNTVDKKEFIKVLNERLEKNYILNIDQRLISYWWNGKGEWGVGAGCVTLMFDKSGIVYKGSYCGDGERYKFKNANGRIKFSADWDVKMNNVNFSFSDNGNTLILGAERFKKVSGYKCC